MINKTDLVKQCSHLFSLPDIYLRLSRLLADDTVGAERIAELISLDAGLAARLLKIANSSFYNFPAQIETVPRAITLIGSRQLCDLVLATSVAYSFSDIDPELLDMDSFWRRNLDTGLVMRHLGKTAQVHDVERLFVMGLLHNIGKLMVLTQAPTEAAEVLEMPTEAAPWVVERDTLGFTFAECGAELLEIWQLPEPLIDAVRHQHQPQKAQVDPQGAALLHIASRAAGWMEQQTQAMAGVDYLQSIDPWAWEYTGLGLEAMDEAINFAQVEAWHLLGLISAPLHQ